MHRGERQDRGSKRNFLVVPGLMANKHKIQQHGLEHDVIITGQSRYRLQVFFGAAVIPIIYSKTDTRRRARGGGLFARHLSFVQTKLIIVCKDTEVSQNDAHNRHDMLSPILLAMQLITS